MRPGRFPSSLTLASVLTLVVGVGANALVFSVVQGLLLTPLPYTDPARLVQLDLARSTDRRSTDVSLQEFADWQTRFTTVQDLAMFAAQDMTLGGVDQPETITGAIVSDRFFPLLGSQSTLGRMLTSQDDATATVVVSHRLWLRRFGSDPALPGRTIILDGRPYVVAGVAPESFRVPDGAEVWIPVGMAKTFAPPQWNMRGFRAFSVIGRLTPGETLATATHDAQAIAAWLSATYPRFSEGITATIGSLQERQVRSARPVLMLLQAAAGLVLMVAVANVMNLSLTRSLSRTREFAVRTALGAGRWTLIRPLLVDALWLGLVGGALALGCAAGGLRLVRSLQPAGWPSFDPVGIDWTVLLATLALSVLVAVIAGVVPAIKASRAIPMDALRQTRTAEPASARTWSGVLIVIQVAVSIVLLVGGVLLTRSLLRVGADPVGVRSQGVLTLKLNLASTAASSGDRPLVLDRIIERVSAVPGVRAVGVISNLPPAVSQMHTTLSLQDPATQVPRDVSLQMIAASPNAFAALGVPLKAGRWFDASDSSSGRRVIVLGETAARQMFGDAGAIGRSVPFGSPGGVAPPPVVIGVVGDVKYSGLHAAPDGALYMPVTQRSFDRQYLVMHTQGTPTDVASSVRSAIAAVDSGVGVSEIRSLDDVVSVAGTAPRLRAWIVMALAVMTALVSGVGLYNLVSRTVTLQTTEIGLRMALGAQRSGVIWFVARRSLFLSGMGAGIGVAIALWSSRLLQAFLFGVTTGDPWYYVLPVTSLLVVATAATLGPVRRATRVDPLIALRHENQ